MPDQPSGNIIGIDLGTTYSVVAVLDQTTLEPIVIPNAEGSNKTPSMVAFGEDGDVLIGEIARRQIAANPRYTITGIKRLMGRYYSDLEGVDEHFVFPITTEDDQILIDVRGVGYTPQQISALILRKLKDAAEDYLGGSVTRAIITVPANFDDLQREATIEAGKMAGLEVERLVNEPTAAAMAYGLGKEKEEVVAVYDFGGGTFDISLLEVARNAFEVLTTTGDSYLGGDDIDNLIVELVAREFEEKFNIDLLAEPLTARRLKDAAERAKCELSTVERTLISVPFVAYKDNTPVHIERRIDREEFEELIRPIVSRTIDCCREALRQAGTAKSNIDKVILVGGSSRIPLVQDLVEEFFDAEPFKGVNPDEIVAMGAATQGGVMSGQLEEVVLLEITPHSLGVEVKNNRVSRIIDKNSTIPIKAAKTFTTTESNQEIVSIHVLQGEEPEAGRNRSLGRFTLTGIKAAPAGMPRIRVMFFINSDGVVEISATDLQSGVEKSLTVVHSFLTDEQYRVERRTASKEARRRRRRTVSRRLGGTLQGKVIERGAAVEPVESKSGTGGDHGAAAQRAAGFMEIEPDFDHEPTYVPSPVGSGGARVRQPRSRPTPLPQARQASTRAPAPASQPGAADSGGTTLQPAAVDEQMGPTWAPSLEAIHAQAEAMSEAPLESVANEDLIGTHAEEIPVSAAAPQAEAAAAIAEPAPADLGPAVEAEPFRLMALLAESMPDAPPSLQQAARLLDDNVAYKDGTGAYRQASIDVERLASDQPENLGFLALAAAMQILMRNAEAANTTIEQICKRFPDKMPLVLDLYSRLIDQYSQYVPALRMRGQIYDAMGDTDQAIADFEAAIVRETSDEAVLGRLEHLYKEKMTRSPNPALEFKQVKLYLKMSRLDDAISVLQKLVNNSSYEQRALKILGLCFWQKNMYYLAWQKFKQLPVADDIKGILYRLASDMEAADQLINAKYALERIAESDLSYMDVEARLKRINQRLRMQQEDLAQTKIPASVEVLQDARFIILDEINRGSMGVVYRARDKVLDEIVAIKVLNDYLCADPQAVNRFKREARAAKRLSHPNIVRIHDFYESSGKKFISMEFIDGQDLKKILMEQGRMSVGDIVKFFAQVCAALQYAHDLDIVHRDIKPANVMITTKDVVKITDFGIAKILKTEELTRSGSMIMGTPLYMAPEQIEGAMIDGRCDIYALGIMLYEALSGKPPFTDGNIEYHHVHTPVPPLPDDVPDALKALIYKAVSKDPGERFQSPGELLLSLQAMKIEQPAP
jgi:molecular chaperone DnaK